jgi:peptidoglycan hydrolase CwlO-like protein
MLNLKTNYIIKSRDIVWLKKSLGKWDKKVEEVNSEFNEQDEDEDEVIEEIKKMSDEPVDDDEKIPEPKLLYKMKKIRYG